MHLWLRYVTKLQRLKISEIDLVSSFRTYVVWSCCFWKEWRRNEVLVHSPNCNFYIYKHLRVIHLRSRVCLQYWRRWSMVFVEKYFFGIEIFSKLRVLCFSLLIVVYKQRIRSQAISQWTMHQSWRQWKRNLGRSQLVWSTNRNASQRKWIELEKILKRIHASTCNFHNHATPTNYSLSGFW